VTGHLSDSGVIPELITCAVLYVIFTITVTVPFDGARSLQL